MNKTKVGKIVNTHGIRGELKVAFEDIDVFEKGMTIYVSKRDEFLEFTLKEFRVHKNHLLIKINDFDNINDVEKYKTYDVYIEKDEDEVYYSDLVGYELVADGTKVGIVADITNNNAHDIFVLDNGVMIPYVDAFVIDINDETKKITVNLIEGLIDED